MVSTSSEIAAHINSQLRNSTNSISDGVMTLSYNQCERAIRNLAGHDSAIAALTLSNSLPDALNLISCLVRSKSFVVVRESINTQPSAEVLTTFCRQMVTRSNVSVNPFFNSDRECMDEGDACLVLRTSGTTNTPKFVLHSQKKVFLNAKRSAARLGLTSKDRVLIAVSIHHSYGLVTAFIPSLITGCSIRLLNNNNVINLNEAIRSFKPDVVFATPGLIEMLLRINVKFRIPKVSITAGDRIRKEIFMQYDQTIGTLLNLYGSTEMGAMAISDSGRDCAHRAEGGVVALPGIEFSIRYNGDGPGDIYCKHDSGYLHYMDYTGKKIPGSSNNIFETNDLGTETEGEIKLHGRSDDKIKRNGTLISFFEIENAIESICSELRKVVVVRKQGQDIIGSHFVAICELKEYGSVDIDTIRRLCRARLSKHLQPDTIEIVEALPLLQNGKVDRKTLLLRFS